MKLTTEGWKEGLDSPPSVGIDWLQVMPLAQVTYDSGPMTDYELGAFLSYCGDMELLSAWVALS